MTILHQTYYIVLQHQTCTTNNFKWRPHKDVYHNSSNQIINGNENFFRACTLEQNINICNQMEYSACSYKKQLKHSSRLLIKHKMPLYGCMHTNKHSEIKIYKYIPVICKYRQPNIFHTTPSKDQTKNIRCICCMLSVSKILEYRCICAIRWRHQSKDLDQH